MRMYSVWNDPHKRWDYYEAMGHLKGGFAPKPRIPTGNRLGVAPDDAARPLPAGAKLVGSGQLARGMIASRKSALGFFGFDTGTLMRFAVYGAIGYVVWTMVLSGPQKAKVRRAVGTKRGRKYERPQIKKKHERAIASARR